MVGEVHDVEGGVDGGKVGVADHGGGEEQDDFEALGVFHLHAREVGLVDGQLAQVAEKGNGDVGLLVAALRAVGVGALAGEGAHAVFGELAVAPPAKVDLGRRFAGGGVGLGAVDGRGAGEAKGLLRHFEFPIGRGGPGLVVVFDEDLLVGVVELDRKFSREDGLWWWGYAAGQPELFGGWVRLCPFGDQEDLAIEDFRVIAVRKGDGIAVLGGWKGGVGMS